MDVHVIEPGPLTDDAGREVDIFHRGRLLSFVFLTEKSANAIHGNDGISKVGWQESRCQKISLLLRS